ncbi:MAG: transketolase [Bacteroides sp.]|nr:transketolase [Ruminococcus flavefaciens]MCM1554823.1 transketolase [Bacteroides sp.]
MKRNGSILRLAKDIRIEALKMVTEAKASHIAGALSMADILAVLYGKYLKFDAKEPYWAQRDRLILSKGHCCTTLYAVLALKGFYPLEKLHEYGKEGSYMISHISSKLPGVEFSSGSLGHGLPYACGLALAAKCKGERHKVVCILGDGEMEEGSNWEAVLFARQHCLDNLIFIIDYNKIQAMGYVQDILGLEPLDKKLDSFGAGVQVIDGNDLEMVDKALACCWSSTEGKPQAIIAHTRKGSGVSFMEDNLKWHYSNPTEEDLKKAIEEIEAR